MGRQRKPASRRAAASRARPPRAGGPAHAAAALGQTDVLGDLFEIPARALEAVSSWVGSSVSMVEKPLGLGVTLAKVAEHSLLDVTEIRSASPDALLPRVRADAHEVLDMLVDAVAMAARSLSGNLGSVVNITASPRPAPPPPSLQPPAAEPAFDRLVVVDMPGPLAPGRAGERPIVMTNESDAPTGDMSFASSDLLAPSGAWIPATHVSFDPTSLAIPPRGSGRVVVRVTIPDGLPAGSYEGLLQGIRVEGQGTLLHVDVA